MAKETPKPVSTPPVETEAKKRGKALYSVLVEIVDTRIAGNRNAGWGAKDSIAVIEAIANKDAELSNCGDVKRFTLSDEAMQIIGAVVNPSAFRQQLEAKDGLNRLDKVEGKRQGSLKSLQAEFGS